MSLSKREKETPILVIAATNRPGALSKIVAEYYVSILEKEGTQARLLSLDRLAPDFIEKALYANKGKDPAFNALAQEVEQAQKMVFVVPQYNGSFPGVLKTFIDGLTVGAADKGATFRHKKCALVGVSKGYQGNILGLSHLTDILTYLGMHVLPTKPYLSSIAPASLEALQAHPQYLTRLQEQALHFIQF